MLFFIIFKIQKDVNNFDFAINNIILKIQNLQREVKT